MRKPLVIALLLAAALPQSAQATSASRTLSVPVGVRDGRHVAAFEIEVLVSTKAASVSGLVVSGRRPQTLGPAAYRRGTVVSAFARSADGRLLGRIVLDARRHGRIDVRLLNAVFFDRSGHRVRTSLTRSRFTVVRPGKNTRYWPPPGHSDTRAFPAGASVTDFNADGVIDDADLASAKLQWAVARQRGLLRTTDRLKDANGDGRVDVGDVQSVFANLGLRLRPVVTPAAPAPPATGLVVTTNGDEPDADGTDGRCLTTAGSCTLRAAIAEANQHVGPDVITFAIPTATEPPTLRLGSSLPPITDPRLTIDGYSEPGARQNAAPLVFDGVPGLTIQGAGAAQGAVAFLVTTTGVVIRGLHIVDVWRPIWLSGPNSRANIVQGVIAEGGDAGVLIDGGANANQIGVPTLAGRNVLGRFTRGVDLYGVGTSGNVMQNNLIGVAPAGTSTWPILSDGVDHNFGASGNLTGGDGPLERNVIAAGYNTGVEISHGWNFPLGPRVDGSEPYQLKDNRVIGNLIGFTPDGRSDPTFVDGRCYLQFCTADNGDGVNVIDGAVRTVVRDNWIAGVRNGILVSAEATQGTVIRSNHLGVSPLGELAPSQQFGVRIELGASAVTLEDNTIASTLSGIAVVSNVNFVMTSGVKARRNVITQTSPRAIDLAGSNHGLGAPNLVRATTVLAAGTACAGCTIDLFRGTRSSPTTYLGSGDAGAGGDFLVTLPLGTVAPGDAVTATVTTPDGETSELSAAGTVTPGETPRFSDDFARVATNGLGGAWTNAGLASLLASDQQARITTQSGGTATGATATIADPSISVIATVRAEKAAIDGRQFAYVGVRAQGGSEYRGTLRAEPDGHVYAAITRRDANGDTDLAAQVPVGSVSSLADAPLRVRIEASGLEPTRLRFRVWRADVPEPAQFAIEATDDTPALQHAGSIVLRAFLAPSATNGPITTTFDDVAVWSLS